MQYRRMMMLACIHHIAEVNAILLFLSVSQYSAILPHSKTIALDWLQSQKCSKLWAIVFNQVEIQSKYTIKKFKEDQISMYHLILRSDHTFSVAK